MKNVRFRVDSRLIHGQVIARWAVKDRTQEIIVVDDPLVSDDFMKDIYVMAAPPGMPVQVLTVEEAAEKWHAGTIGEKRTLFLFKDVAHGARLFKMDVPIKELQIGGLPSGPGKKLVYKTIALGAEDYPLLDEMVAKGVEVYFQMLPEEDPFPYGKIKR